MWRQNNAWCCDVGWGSDEASWKVYLRCKIPPYAKAYGQSGLPVGPSVLYRTRGTSLLRVTVPSTAWLLIPILFHHMLLLLCKYWENQKYLLKCHPIKRSLACIRWRPIIQSKMSGIDNKQWQAMTQAMTGKTSQNQWEQDHLNGRRRAAFVYKCE